MGTCEVQIFDSWLGGGSLYHYSQTETLMSMPQEHKLIFTKQEQIMNMQKTHQHNLPKTFNTTPNCILDKIESHSLQGYAGYFKRVTLDSYQVVCLTLHCYICSRN